MQPKNKFDSYTIRTYYLRECSTLRSQFKLKEEKLKIMKRLVVLIPIFLLALAANSQPEMQLSAFEHDFGVFKEEAGNQKFDFIVVNTGNSPLVIQRIVPSCGCTTPEWTKQPIPPNGKGKITAIYDPANRPGPFNKTLSVYSNSKPEVVILSIKGQVTPREKTIEEMYMFLVGDIRFESNHLAFTNIKKTEKKIRVMPVINPSSQSVRIEFESLPEHLQIKANPSTLKPGQKGIIEGTYDATKNPNWGNISDMVRIKLNGVPVNNVFYYVSANLVEDFSGLSKDEMDNAPVFKTASSTVDLGKIPGSVTKEVVFSFKNDGKRGLIIRHIRSTCGCTAIQPGDIVGKEIKPGESGVIKASFNSGAYKGKVTKAIYVYTNDPRNSEVMLMLNADVEPAVASTSQSR
jgi:hypothetical protein